MDQPASEKQEEEEEEVENNDETEEQNGDVQSFVTALENETDHLTDSVNDLHLGHDDEGKPSHLSISLIVTLSTCFSRLDHSIEFQYCQISSFGQCRIG